MSRGRRLRGRAARAPAATTVLGSPPPHSRDGEPAPRHLPAAKSSAERAHRSGLLPPLRRRDEAQWPARRRGLRHAHCQCRAVGAGLGWAVVRPWRALAVCSLSNSNQLQHLAVSLSDVQQLAVEPQARDPAQGNEILHWPVPKRSGHRPCQRKEAPDRGSSVQASFLTVPAVTCRTQEIGPRCSEKSDRSYDSSCLRKHPWQRNGNNKVEEYRRLPALSTCSSSETYGNNPGCMTVSAVTTGPHLLQQRSRHRKSRGHSYSRRLRKTTLHKPRSERRAPVSLVRRSEEHTSELQSPWH